MATLIIMFTALLLVILQFTEAQLGVSFGWNGNNLPTCQQTINIYETNNIGRMRIYYPDETVLQGIQGTNIKLFLDIPNYQLQDIAQNPSSANQWIQKNVAPYASSIIYIAVGNEVTQDQKQYVCSAMTNILNVLGSTNSLADKIKVTTVIGMSEIKNSYPPSNGEFVDVPYMDRVINILKQNNAPLMLNVYPYLTFIQSKGNITLDFALFSSPGPVFTDPNNGLKYQNLFDAQIDAVYAALYKRGAPNTPVRTSETGWPSGGGDHATVALAWKYYHNLVNHARVGSPRKPGQSELYLFSMFDENLKPGDEIEKHFGIFNTNGTPKYGNINFT